jgi:hypothetical protein
VVALCACVQFVAQFLGIALFSFEGLVPSALLIEGRYNVAVPLSLGSDIYKANGIFLLEPSILSQYVAIAIAIEFLYFRSVPRLILLILALLFSFSGTGLLTLGFALTAAIMVERRPLPIIATGAVAGLIAVVFLLMAPQFVDIFLGRIDELSSDQTSGFLRFISPFMLLSDVTTDPRAIIGFGPGSAERFNVPYEYAVNAPVKILIDYGIFGLVAYALFVIHSYFRRDLKALSLAGLFWFVSGGGYHLTPSVIYTLASLFTWSADFFIGVRRAKNAPHDLPPTFQRASGYPRDRRLNNCVGVQG